MCNGASRSHRAERVVAVDLGDGTALAGSGVDGRVYRVEGAHTTVYAENGRDGGDVARARRRRNDLRGHVSRREDLPLARAAERHPQTPELLVQLPATAYVWALAWDRTRHVLLAATGSEGKLFAIDRAGHASVVFDSDERISTASRLRRMAPCTSAPAAAMRCSTPCAVLARREPSRDSPATK